jgi:hypothetical protein
MLCRWEHGHIHAIRRGFAAFVNKRRNIKIAIRMQEKATTKDLCTSMPQQIE